MGAPQLPDQGPGTPWVKYGLIGCAVLSLLGILGAGACVVGGGSCFYGLSKVLKSSEAYQMTERLAKESPVVREHLGEVTGFGFMPTGTVTSDGGTGSAELSVSVTGTKGSGSIAITARAAGGQWKLTSATLEVPGGRTFPLLGVEADGAAPTVPSTVP